MHPISSLLYIIFSSFDFPLFFFSCFLLSLSCLLISFLKEKQAEARKRSDSREDKRIRGKKKKEKTEKDRREEDPYMQVKRAARVVG